MSASRASVCGIGSPVLISHRMSAGRASVCGIGSHVLESRSLWITTSPGPSPKIGLEISGIWGYRQLQSKWYGLKMRTLVVSAGQECMGFCSSCRGDWF